MSTIPAARIALVTDSTADIPASLADAYAIQVVPNIIVMNGQMLKDGVGITREEFYRRMPVTRELSTATESSGVYEALYHRLLETAEHVISIHAASQLSGILNAATAAANLFPGRVHVFDSGQLSLGVGFQVLAAAEAIQAGQPLPDVLDVLLRVRPRSRVVAMLDTLEYVRRSGRVSWARARIGEMLRVKPFVEVKDGQVSSLGEARTRRKGEERLFDLLQELARQHGPLERLAILHSNAPDSAKEFMDALPAAITSQLRPLQDGSLPIVNVTTIIGVHIGPNALGFAAILKNA